jgi:DCN1-like protein 4/5
MLTFVCSEDKKKCIEIPVACELLNLVLGLQFRPQVEKLINYLKVMIACTSSHFGPFFSYFD